MWKVVGRKEEVDIMGDQASRNANGLNKTLDEDALNERPDVGVHSDGDDEKNHAAKGTDSSPASRYHDASSRVGSSFMTPNLPSSVRITRSTTKKGSQGRNVTIHQDGNDHVHHHHGTPAAGTQVAGPANATATTTTNGGTSGRQKRKKKTSPFNEWRRCKKPRIGPVNGAKVKGNGNTDSTGKTSNPSNNRRSTRSATMQNTTDLPTTPSMGSPIPRAARLNKK